MKKHWRQRRREAAERGDVAAQLRELAQFMLAHGVPYDALLHAGGVTVEVPSANPAGYPYTIIKASNGDKQ